MRWVGGGRDDRCTLTLALRNGPITRVTSLTGLRMLAKPRRALLGRKVAGEGCNRRQYLGEVCCRLRDPLAHE